MRGTAEDLSLIHIYIPLYPALTSNTVLAWKKNQAMSHVAGALVYFIEEYVKGMDNDEI